MILQIVILVAVNPMKLKMRVQTINHHLIMTQQKGLNNKVFKNMNKREREIYLNTSINSSLKRLLKSLSQIS